MVLFSTPRRPATSFATISELTILSPNSWAKPAATSVPCDPISLVIASTVMLAPECVQRFPRMPASARLAELSAVGGGQTSHPRAQYPMMTCEIQVRHRPGHAMPAAARHLTLKGGVSPRL